MASSNVTTVAVLGAGTMGHGIAELAALSGCNVRLRDVSEDIVRDGYERIEQKMEPLIDRGRISEGTASKALDRIETYIALEDAVAEADFVVETVPEKPGVKSEVFETIDEMTPDDVVLATNTSTLSITELSEATSRPERVCGMHFFNPPVEMELVEIVSGEHSGEATLSTIEHFAESLGKTPICVRKDVPGFVVNRVLAPMLNDAAWLVATNEATVEEVDRTANGELGLPMGCFRLMDYIGIDVAVDVLRNMHDALGGAYEPCPLLLEKVEAGRLGHKTGSGFYDYNSQDPTIDSCRVSDSIAEELMAIAINETTKLVADDVAEASTIDDAMKLGASFRDGPTVVAEEMGYRRLHSVLSDRFDEMGELRYEPAPLLEEWALEVG